jgi:hypothetical protein
MALEDARDEALLELAAGLPVQDSLVDHLGDQRLQLVLHR